MSEKEINYTELLEQEYGDDRTAQQLIQDFREDLKMSDEEIYKFMNSYV